MAQVKPDVNKVFHALGDPGRRAMLEKLRKSGPVSVSQLAAPMEMSLAAVVQHLQILEECGLIQTEKVGRTRTCRIAGNGIHAATAWLESLRDPWDKRLDRLAQLLEDTKKKL